MGERLFCDVTVYDNFNYKNSVARRHQTSKASDMNKKPVKPAASVGATKPKPKPQPPPVVEEKIEVKKFAHSCSKQQFALVWLDEELVPDDPRCGKLTTELKKIVNKIDVFNDLENCVDFMKKIHHQDIYFIVSNPNEKILGTVNQITAVTVIFILDDKHVSMSSWTSKWPKVRSIHSTIEDLCKSLKLLAAESDSDYKEFRVVPSDELGRRNINEIDPSFMYTQLIKEIILEMDYDEHSPENLVAYVRKNHIQLGIKNLSGLDDFKQNYLKDDKTPVWWYTLDSFLYRFVNRTLYQQKFNAVIETAFFIKDLYNQLADLHKEQNWVSTIVPTLYRGQGMTFKELDGLKKNRNGFFVFNSFMSTSTDPNKAMDFIDMAFQDHSECAAMFEITVDQSVESAVFAELKELSRFKEKEVLFAFGTVFLIKDAQPHPKSSPKCQIWNIKLTLSTNTGENLRQLMQHIRQQIDGPTPLYRLGAFLLKVAQYERAYEIFHRALKVARTDQDKANIYYQVGFALYNQGKPKDSLAWYEPALAIYQRTVGEDHPNTASIYNNLGLAHSQMKDYRKSLDFYNKAREIYEKVKRDDLILATCYNNIAADYVQINELRKAIEFYKKSLEIHQKQRVENNPDRAILENNIGILHQKLNQRKEAIERFKNALEIAKKGLPFDHPNIAIYKSHLETAQQLDKYK